MSLTVFEYELPEPKLDTVREENGTIYISSDKKEKIIISIILLKKERQLGHQILSGKIIAGNTKENLIGLFLTGVIYENPKEEGIKNGFGCLSIVI